MPRTKFCISACCVHDNVLSDNSPLWGILILLLVVIFLEEADVSLNPLLPLPLLHSICFVVFGSLFFFSVFLRLGIGIIMHSLVMLQMCWWQHGDCWELLTGRPGYWGVAWGMLGVSGDLQMWRITS